MYIAVFAGRTRTVGLFQNWPHNLEFTIAVHLGEIRTIFCPRSTMRIPFFPFRLSVVFVCSVIIGWFVSGSISVSNDETKQFRWGSTFALPLQSSNIDNSCKHNGRPVCCGLVDPHISPHVYPHKQQEDTQVQHGNVHSSNNCEITKEYVPSPYEQRHIAKAKEIDKLETEEERRHILTLFLLEDFLHVPIWLERVKFHMTKAVNRSYKEQLPPTKEDLEYLSRFQITQHCEENNQNTTWYEFIEPLTVHARHPYSFLRCMEMAKEVKIVNDTQLQYKDQLYTITNNKTTIPRLDIVNSDYVLLQRLNQQPPHHNNNNNHVVPHHNNKRKHTTASPKRYFLDAGCSTFDSSLNWFLCAYLQVRLLCIFFCFLPFYIYINLTSLCMYNRMGLILIWCMVGKLHC